MAFNVFFLCKGQRQGDEEKSETRGKTKEKSRGEKGQGNTRGEVGQKTGDEVSKNCICPAICFYHVTFIMAHTLTPPPPFCFRHISELFGYTNETNPFGDANLTQQFAWRKKSEKEHTGAPTKGQLKAKHQENIGEIMKVCAICIVMRQPLAS